MDLWEDGGHFNCSRSLEVKEEKTKVALRDRDGGSERP